MLKSLFIAFFLSFPFFIKGEAQTTEQSKSSGLKKCTVFTAGDDNVNSYRIPSEKNITEQVTSSKLSICTDSCG